MSNPDRIRLLCAKQGIELYLKTGMQVSRNASPKVLRAIAGGYTGKTYAASRKGLTSALADLQALLGEVRSADRGGLTVI